MLKNILAAVRTVAADALKLRDKQLASAVAGGVVAIAAAIAGVHLTVAEVAGWLSLVVLGAGAVEKLLPAAKPAPVKAAAKPAAKSSGK